MTNVWMSPCVRCIVRHDVMAYARQHRAAYADAYCRGACWPFAPMQLMAGGRLVSRFLLSWSCCCRRSRNLSIERRELQCHSKMISCHSEC